MKEINDRVIVKQCQAKVSLERAWWKWTTHEGLLTFFGLDNKVQLIPCGPYEIYFLMDQPKGLRGGEGNKVLSFLPLEMLSFTWNAPPNFPEVRNHQHRTWVVLNFEALSKNETKITLKHVGWLEGTEWEAVFDYFDKAWTRVLEWFQASCTSENS